MASSGAVPPTDPSPGTTRVLIVDDERQVAELTAEYLKRRRADFAVQVAVSPDDVMDRGTELDVDCIVSDYDMPGTNGLEFLEWVRTEYPNLPFILFTGKGSEEVASEAISAGVTDYLQKRGGTSHYDVLANRIENAVERYRAQEAVEFERSRRSPLFQHSPDPIIEVEYTEDRAEVTAVNPAFEATFGLEAAELRGESILDTFDTGGGSEQNRAELKRIRDEVRDGQPVIQEVSRVADGRPKDFLLRIVPFEVNNSRRAYGWYVDLSEQRAAERRFREIFEQSNEAMLVVDPHTDEIKTANPAAADLLGYDREELLDLSPTDIHPHEIERFRDFVDSVTRTGRGWTDELSCRTKSGETVPVEISASALAPDRAREMLAVLRPAAGEEAR